MVMDFYTYKEAVEWAKGECPSGRIKRVSSRLWLGNGMGYSPAEYAIVNDYGKVLLKIWSQSPSDDWYVTKP